MKRLHTIIFLLAIFFSIGTSFGKGEINRSESGNKAIDTAMQLYKTMKINKAADHAIRHISNIHSLSSIEKLKFSLILNKNFAIYNDIYKKSIESQRVFLESLTADKSTNKSQMAPLFLTEIYLLEKQYSAAKEQLSLLNKNSDKEKTLQKIYRAWLAKSSNKKEYANIVLTIDKKDPLMLMAMDTINIITTGESSIDLSIVKSAEHLYINNNHPHSMRFSNYALRIYSHRGQLSDARRIFLNINQKTPSLVEEITQFKLINFYEPSLINSLARYYYQLSKKILTELEKDKKYHDIAIYYLSDLELISANIKSAARFNIDMQNLRRLPKSLAPLSEIRQSGHAYLTGKTTRAHQIWKKAVNNTKNNPAIIAEAVLMCLYLEANCPTIVQTARLKAENGRSKRFENLNTNVGRYLLLKKENSKAVRLLENALDRGNADGLLMNDPILLLNLADIYRIEKRFSESLQIYFSLGKHFPILRQVQDAAQGEYLFRQRSSGSNRLL